VRIISLGNRIIKEENPPYIIAEIGVNHEGSFDKAKELIRLAKEGGADAVKFQTYKAETLAAKNSPAYWDTSMEPTRSQYELFKRYDSFDEEEYILLAEYCRKTDIDFLSTPFDEKAIEFLAPLVPCFKIASADITNVPFLRRIAAKSKPVILSTGASTVEEITDAVTILNNAGCGNIALLHCVLNYPTNNENANLNMIEGLKTAFPHLVVGYSDHTVPDREMTVLTAAYLKGALIIEKHFTDDKTLPGNDHYHAMDAEDLKNFRKKVETLMILNGKAEKFPLLSEQSARLNARRSIVLRNAVRAGEVLHSDMLICKRPGTGITAANFDEIVGSVAARDLAEDHVLTWSDIKRDASGAEKVVAIIQARMGSTRFPGKMTAKLAGYRLIDWVLSRVIKAQKVGEFVLALPDSPENDVLEQTAIDYKITVIRGSENNVLDRFIRAARATRADVIVRVCADNPYIDSREIDRLVDFFMKNRPEYAFNHLNRLGNNYPDGFGAEILSRSVLEDLNTRCTQKHHREHVTAYIWEHADDYNILTFKAPAEIAYPDVKLDVDYKDDLVDLESHLNRSIELTGWRESPLMIPPVNILASYTN